MINSYYKISLNIHNHSSQVLLRAKKGDTGRILLITLTDGRNPYPITEECRAVFAAKKPDGNILYNKCSTAGNVIVYEFTPQTTAAAGVVECEIKLYGTEYKLLTSARFTLLVVDTVYNDGELESTKEVTALTALVSEAIDLMDDVEYKMESGAFKGDPGNPGVYILAEGETLDDAPADVDVVIDPNGDVDPAGTVTEEQIAAAVEAYMEKRQVSSASISSVYLPASGWVGSASPYSQVVTISGTTANSQVDLTPSVQQLAVFHDKDLTFVTENEDGVVTVYAIGQKPENDYTIQVTITEVAV